MSKHKQQICIKKLQNKQKVFISTEKHKQVTWSNVISLRKATGTIMSNDENAFMACISLVNTYLDEHEIMYLHQSDS